VPQRQQNYRGHEPSSRFRNASYRRFHGLVAYGTCRIGFPCHRCHIGFGLLSFALQILPHSIHAYTCASLVRLHVSFHAGIAAALLAQTHCTLDGRIPNRQRSRQQDHTRLSGLFIGRISGTLPFFLCDAVYNSISSVKRSSNCVVRVCDDDLDVLPLDIAVFVFLHC
jgi:hypothetical protein